MLRSLALGAALAFSVPAFACPMADAAAFAQAAEKVQQMDGAKATFKVEGMHCGDCSTKVTKALKSVEGVKDAAVDYQTGKTFVAYEEGKVEKKDLLAAIATTGFKAELTEG
jgi:copper chaperone CopZ